MQECSQIGRKVLGDPVGTYEEPQSSLRVDDVALPAGVDRVAVAALALLVIDLEFFRRALRGAGVAPEPEEVRVEGGPVLPERVPGSALGIHGDEQDLHPFGIWPDR